MATIVASGAKNPKKQEYFSRLTELATTHDQVIIVEADNVGSRQMAEIRLALRGKATILMGKNTMMKTCLNKLVEERPELNNLIDLVKLNIGLVFCEADPVEVRKVILNFRVPAPAKQGAVAPNDVFIPPGPTGMDPGQTSFFQSLGIATKIVKGQIEIQNEVHIVKEGEKVTASQAVLLQKLNIKPFSYGLKTKTVYDNGSVYPASVLDISAEDLAESMKKTVSTLAAISLGTGVPTKVSAPHSILNTFRKIAGVALAVDFVFPEIEALKNALENPGAFAAAAAPAAAAAAEEAAPAEESEEEEDDMGFSLFD